MAGRIRRAVETTAADISGTAALASALLQEAMERGLEFSLTIYGKEIPLKLKLRVPDESPGAENEEAGGN